jgi:hypothetical protein
LRAKVTGNLFYDEGEFDKPYPASIVPPDLKRFSILDLDPLEIARQITLQGSCLSMLLFFFLSKIKKDAAIYQGMQTRELLDCQWTKVSKRKKKMFLAHDVFSLFKAGGTKAPTVLVITKRFNAIAAWVVGVILREDDLARRAKVKEENCHCCWFFLLFKWSRWWSVSFELQNICWSCRTSTE